MYFENREILRTQSPNISPVYGHSEVNEYGFKVMALSLAAVLQPTLGQICRGERWQRKRLRPPATSLIRVGGHS